MQSGRLKTEVGVSCELSKRKKASNVVNCKFVDKI